jgi:3-(3-hydroxy-phenyl)propionate hydroxylase
VEVLTSNDAEDVGRWLRQHDAKAALIRPDRYVRGAVRDEADVNRLVAALCTSAHRPTVA